MEYTTVAASPGYFAIGLDADNINEYRLPVIAWRVPVEDGWSIPVTPAGDERHRETRVSVECLGCGHLRLFSAAMLLVMDRRRPVWADDLIAKLEDRVRCQRCDERGKVILTIVWHDAPTRPL
jgi:hypothetical protein